MSKFFYKYGYSMDNYSMSFAEWHPIEIESIIANDVIRQIAENISVPEEATEITIHIKSEKSQTL